MRKGRLLTTIVMAMLCVAMLFTGCGDQTAVTPTPTPSASANPGPVDPTPPPVGALGIDMCTETSYVNVFRDYEIGEDAPKTLDWVVAKNEYESAQIVLHSSKAFAIESVEFSDLVSGDNKIDKANLKYNFVGYERMVFNSPGVKPLRDAPEYFPDVLLNEGSLDVEPYSAQPVWVTLYVPKTAEAGDYTGTATVQTDRGPVEVEMTAEVNDVTVPDAGSDESNYNVIFWQLMIGGGFGKTYADSHASDHIVKLFGSERWTEDWWKLVGDIADVMKENRLNTLYLPTVQLLLDGGSVRNEDGTWTFNFSKFDEYVQFFLDRGVVNRFMGYMMMTGGNTNLIMREADGRSCTTTTKFDSETSDAWFEAYLTALYDHLHEKGWAERWTQCLRDEPPMDAASVAQYNRLVDMYKKYMKEIPFGDPTQGADNSAFLLKHNAPTLIPLISVHNDNRAMYQNLEEGRRVYTYSCVVPQGTYLNRFIDLPVYYGRTIGWYNFNAGANGYLHWGLMAWYRPITDFALGDTATIYPDVENNTVKSSIRMANLRDGAEDYELLKLLEKDDPTSAKALADMIAKDARTNYSKDTRQMAEVRKMLVRAAAGKPGAVGRPEGIELSEKSVSLDVAEGVRVSAEIKPTDSLSKALQWDTDDDGVVAVSQNGDLWAVAPGTATITVSSVAYPDVKTQCSVTVKQPDETARVALPAYRDTYVRDGDFSDYRFGGSSALQVAKGSKNNSNKSYFAFDATGLASGVDKAVLRLYASSVGASASRKLALYAVTGEWTEHGLGWNNSLAVGEKAGEAVVANTTGKALSNVWVEIDVTAFVKANPCAFTLMLVDESETASDQNKVTLHARENAVNRPTLIVTGTKIKYEPVRITDIDIDAQLSMLVGEDRQLSPAGVPQEAVEHIFRFSSSDPENVYVNAAGHIFARATGTAVITVKSGQNPDVSAECEITVGTDGRNNAFFATDDATIESHRPGMNFGSGAEFLANKIAPQRNAVLQFQVTGLNKPIASARLRLYATMLGKAAVNGIQVWQNDTTFWKEGSVCWNNAPKAKRVIGEISVTNPTPAYYGAYYDWLEIDIDPACVGEDGRVSLTIVASGGDRINFASRQGEYCPVLIVDYGQPVTEIVLEDAELERPGDTKMLSVAVTPAENHEPLEFVSSDESVVTVDGSGLLTAVGGGTATVTASSGDVSDSCTVVVRDPINVTGITLGGPVTLQAGGETKLVPVYAPENANFGLELQWSSSDESVVKVVDGTLYARKPGKATITATSELLSNISATCEVTVTQPEHAAAFFPTKDASIETHIDSKVGMNSQLWVYKDPKRYALLQFQLSGIDQTAVSVRLRIRIANYLGTGSNKLGVWRAAEKDWDEATVTKKNAPARTGDELGSYTFTPKQSGWVEFELDPSCAANGALTLAIEVLSGGGVYFSSAQSNFWPMLVVDYGQPVTEIALTDVTIARPGLKAELNAAITPAEGHAAIAYRSLNESVVTVDANGVLTAVAPGSAQIEATSGDITRTCTVTVGETVELTALSLDKTAATINPGSELQLNAVFTPGNANLGTDLTWESSDESVVFVTAEGKLIGIKAGTATVTATSAEFPSLKASCEVTVEAAANTEYYAPAADATLNGSGAGTNYGASNVLHTIVSSNMQTVLLFDLGNLSGTAAKVTLRLRLRTVSADSQVLGVYFAPNANFTESGVNWNTFKGGVGEQLGSLTVTGKKVGDFIDIELDASKITGGKLALILRVDDGVRLSFDSKEAQYGPMLIVKKAD